MIVGTAGHVDHGKTALVRALTGIDTDRLQEEKTRGISIDLGFAYMPTPDGRILGFVDVPGHERFAAIVSSCQRWCSAWSCDLPSSATPGLAIAPAASPCCSSPPFSSAT